MAAPASPDAHDRARECSPFCVLPEWEKHPMGGSKGVRVLVVEDQWHIATTVKRFLEAAGLRVIGPAASVSEAQRLLAEHRPDFAVVDLNLKGELAHSLIDRLLSHDVRVVVATGYVEDAQAARKQVSAILRKPFSQADLLAALRQAVDRRSESPEARPGSCSE